MNAWAKWLFGIGIALIAVAALLWIGGKLGIPLGKLPGDIHIEKGKTSIYFPVATCIALSVVLTLLINLVLWLMRRG